VTEPDNIAERVTRLEHSVAEARKDAAAARILAGGADRDVAEMRTELRAHTQTLNALRETQIEQGREMRQGFAQVESRFAKVEGDMREGFAQVRSEMGEGFAQIRGEMGEGLAQVRSEMGEGFEQVRGEMGEGFAMLKKAIDKSNES